MHIGEEGIEKLLINMVLNIYIYIWKDIDPK
jgi:hypothetical protein